MRTAPATGRPTLSLVQSIKWVASLFQIAGYGLTAYGVTPLNIQFFLVGLLGWFAVGLLWRDRAIVLIHLVALAAMLSGLAGG